MLKTLLICTTLVATPALAQTNNSGGMNHNGAMAGMSGTNGEAMQGMQQGQMQGIGMAGMAGGAESGGMGMSGMMGGAGGEGMMEGMMEKMQTMMGKMMMQMMMGRMEGMGQGGMGSGGMSGIMGGMSNAPQGVGGSPLSEPGQSGFAAIAEVVRQLEADPNTDWSKVTIDALRQHLRDMDVVTIDSTAVAEDVEGGVRFTITGGADVAPSITRMAVGHAGVMDGVDGWRYSADALDNGATVTVLVPEADLAKLKGLGFYGLLASGPHHQPHHWMMANGGGMGG
jgi:hypothetical protein